MIGVEVRKEVRRHIGGLVVEAVDVEPGEVSDALDGPELRRHLVRASGGANPRARRREDPEASRPLASVETDHRPETNRARPARVSSSAPAPSRQFRRCFGHVVAKTMARDDERCKPARSAQRGELVSGGFFYSFMTRPWGGALARLPGGRADETARARQGAAVVLSVRRDV